MVAIALLALIPLAGIGGGQRATAPPSQAAFATLAPRSPAPIVDEGPTATSRVPALLASPTPPAPTDQPTERPTDSPAPTPSPPATPSPSFDHATVIKMAFPLRAGIDYHYRNNYGEIRTGPVEAYNHVFGIRDGKLRRAHDGIDIYAARGTSVVAPFEGRVIDPAKRWQPWQPQRYGICVVIVSTERASRGYAVLLCHLDERRVRIGAQVSRGRVVGTVGVSGNAEDAHAQLHLELRAPFAIAWSEAGGRRLVDAFNPYRSLRAADPAIAN